MAFTEPEIAEHTATLEEQFWTHRRPPLHLRDKVREGQRFDGTSIELFLVRPAFQRPGEWIEEAIAKVQFVRSCNVWQLFWKRADGKWHHYPPCPEAALLGAALHTIHQDPKAAFSANAPLRPLPRREHVRPGARRMKRGGREG